MGKTRFTDPAAVEAWDAWFRWREADELRDLTIDATWQRVADAIASAERTRVSAWAQHFADAFSEWRLLPDERLLREAGKTQMLQAPVKPRAALNLAAFIDQPHTSSARFDRDHFISTAALAVRLLDNVISTLQRPVAALRIGLIGMADALSQLGLGYASDRACRQAGEMAAALAEGCLEGTLKLAHERGPTDADRRRAAMRWRSRGAAGAAVAQILHDGVRHARLTAIDAQPRIALFANNVADALDPRVLIEPDLQRAKRAKQSDEPHAAPRWRDQTLHRGDDMLAQTAQLALRAAIQPWIDRAIDYPLLALHDPDSFTRAECTTLASAYGLKTPRWRLQSG